MDCCSTQSKITPCNAALENHFELPNLSLKVVLHRLFLILRPMQNLVYKYTFLLFSQINNVHCTSLLLFISLSVVVRCGACWANLVIGTIPPPDHLVSLHFHFVLIISSPKSDSEILTKIILHFIHLYFYPFPVICIIYAIPLCPFNGFNGEKNHVPVSL